MMNSKKTKKVILLIRISVQVSLGLISSILRFMGAKLQISLQKTSFRSQESNIKQDNVEKFKTFWGSIQESTTWKNYWTISQLDHTIRKKKSFISNNSNKTHHMTRSNNRIITIQFLGPMIFQVLTIGTSKTLLSCFHPTLIKVLLVVSQQHSESHQEIIML